MKTTTRYKPWANRHLNYGLFTTLMKLQATMSWDEYYLYGAKDDQWISEPTRRQMSADWKTENHILYSETSNIKVLAEGITDFKRDHIFSPAASSGWHRCHSHQRLRFRTLGDRGRSLFYKWWRLRKSLGICCSGSSFIYDHGAISIWLLLSVFAINFHL